MTLFGENTSPLSFSDHAVLFGIILQFPFRIDSLFDRTVWRAYLDNHVLISL